MQKVKPKITPDYRKLLEQSLDRFKTDCLAKYDKGRKEHPKSDVKDIDFEKEIFDEIKDLVIYNMLNKILCHTQKEL